MPTRKKDDKLHVAVETESKMGFIEGMGLSVGSATAIVVGAIFVLGIIITQADKMPWAKSTIVNAQVEAVDKDRLRDYNELKEKISDVKTAQAEKLNDIKEQNKAVLEAVSKLSDKFDKLNTQVQEMRMNEPRMSNEVNRGRHNDN